MCRTDISYTFSLSLYIFRQNMKTRDNKNNNKMHKTLLKHTTYIESIEKKLCFEEGTYEVFIGWC